MSPAFVRSPDQVAAVLQWLDPPPGVVTLLMVEHRLAEVAAEHADSLAELRRPYNEIDCQRWQRQAREHRQDAAILRARMGLR